MYKPGYKTTELAVTVLANIGFLLAALTSHLSPHWAAIASAVSVAAYNGSRGLAKLAPPPIAIVPSAPVQSATTLAPPPSQ
jgi:hypothetical protein